MMLAVCMAIHLYITATLTHNEIMCMHKACTLIPSWGPYRPVLELGHAGHAPSRSIHSQACSSTRVITASLLTFDIPEVTNELVACTLSHLPNEGGDSVKVTSRTVVLSCPQWLLHAQQLTCARALHMRSSLL